MTPVFTPQLNDEVTEAVHDLGVVVEVRRRLNVPDRPQPSCHPIEISKLLLQRGEDRKPCQPRGIVSLVEAQVTTYNALYENSGAANRRMARDVSHPRVDVDQLEIAGRRHRLGQCQSEFLEPVIDSSDRPKL